jgi:hypothetical protein
MGQGPNGELRYADLRYACSRQPGQGLWLVGLNGAVANQDPPIYLRNRPSLDSSAVKQLFRVGFGSECDSWPERTGPLG